MKTVLLVDDSEADQFLHESIIAAYDPDIRIQKAHDGSEALEILKTGIFEPDLILLDLNMPGMGGLEFLENYSLVHENSTSAPVVILSSSDLHADKADTLKYSIVKLFLTKPLSLEKMHILKGMNENIPQ